MDNKDLKVGFIGGGNMARAIAGGLLRAGHTPTAIAVAEPSATAREKISALGAGLRVTTANPEVARDADVLVLAVKPQVMPGVIAELAGVTRPAGQLLISIAAGVSLAALSRALGSAPAVRIMPNQPALIGEGMSALAASTDATAAHRAQALYIAEATGCALWLADESLMDAVTAVSGSGPAYFYLLMEIMEQCAIELGLPPDAARKLVRQTALGAACMAGTSNEDLTALRESVTSPGGTTAAALAVLERAGLSAIVKRALTAARDRGAELGRG